ncbi:hypothetical protein [Cellulomonas sp.]|uniref:hypothetical protein n=1 Tax=Cellulomonas sp. TaxID=40001 RepID=UPI001B20EAEA|nr:hypothetical protein [Cellulomonas sp.]MBO9553785.1 hypothetical protein [Cellulomonas sp.]
MTNARTQGRSAGLAARATGWGRGVAARCHGRWLARWHEDGGPVDRGDVPGWVLVTLMTAGLVTALWMIAGPALGRVFEDAIAGVTGP